MFPGMKGGVLFFDPQERNFYRHDFMTQNLKCCSQQFLNFYQSRNEKKYKCYMVQELCKSAPGMEHVHASPCRSSVEFSTFYWACQLYLAQQVVEEQNPITVIAHIASTWHFKLPDFVVNPLANVFLVSTVKNFCSLMSYSLSKEQFQNNFGDEHFTKFINFLKAQQPTLPRPITPGEFCYFSTSNPFLTVFILTGARPNCSNGDGSRTEKVNESEGESFAFNLKCLVIILVFIFFSLVDLNLNIRKRMLSDTADYQPPPTFVSSSSAKTGKTPVKQLPHNFKKNSAVAHKSSDGNFCN